MTDCTVFMLNDLIAARPHRAKHYEYAKWESSIGQFIVDLPPQQQAGAAELLAHHLYSQLGGMPLKIPAWIVGLLLVKAGMPDAVAMGIVQQIIEREGMEVRK